VERGNKGRVVVSFRVARVFGAAIVLALCGCGAVLAASLLADCAGGAHTSPVPAQPALR
jgi:hypothetical protein